MGVKIGDTIVFNHLGVNYTYKVRDSFLLNLDDKHNAVILKLLYGDKYEEVLEEEYGYAPGFGNFPTCVDGDIDALNRIITRIRKDLGGFKRLIEDTR